MVFEDGQLVLAQQDRVRVVDNVNITMAHRLTNIGSHACYVSGNKLFKISLS